MVELNKYDILKDIVLLKYYRRGDDKVVHFWMAYRYFNNLLFHALAYLKEREAARDALGDVRLKLIEVKYPSREGMLKLIDGTVKVSLRKKVRSRAIDIYRKEKPYYTGKTDEEIILLIEEKSYESFLPGLIAKNQINLLKKNFEERYDETDIKMVDLLLAYGSGKLKPIAKSLGVNVKEARVIRQRVIRRAKRILLNINKPYGKAS